MNNDRKKLPVGWIIGLILVVISSMSEASPRVVFGIFICFLVIGPIVAYLVYKTKAESNASSQNTTHTGNYAASYGREGQTPYTRQTTVRSPGRVVPRETMTRQQRRPTQQQYLPYGARSVSGAGEGHLCDDEQHNGSERAYEETLNDLEEGYNSYSGVPESVGMYLSPEQLGKKYNELRALLKAGVIGEEEYNEKLREYQSMRQ